MFTLFRNVRPDKTQVFLQNSHLLFESQPNLLCLQIWRRSLFLRLRLPFTLFRHENGDLGKRSSNRWNLKTSALRVSADGKHFQNGAF